MKQDNDLESNNKLFSAQYAIDNERRMTRMEGKIDKIIESQSNLCKRLEDHMIIDKEKWELQRERDEGQDEAIELNRVNSRNVLIGALSVSLTIIGFLVKMLFFNN